MAKKERTDYWGIRLGKKLKVTFYKSKISVNGNQENNFSYTEFNELPNGEREVRTRYFVKFWGEYDIKNGDYVFVNKIMDVNCITYFDEKTKKYVPTCYITIGIGDYDKYGNQIGSKKQDNYQPAENEDDYYYGGSSNNSSFDYNPEDI